MLDSPFRPRTPDELKLQEQLEKDFNEYFDKLIETGRNLLADERYGAFRSIFEKLTQTGIELFVSYESKDLREFYCYMSRLQERIKALRLLTTEAESMVENPEAYKKSPGWFDWFKRMFKK